jgi:hypothetical protein
MVGIAALFAIYLILLIDGGCSGYRSAAGRDACILKQGYYRRAVGKGLIAGQGIALLSAALCALCGLTLPEAKEAAFGALWVYVPYGALVVGALTVRLIPSIDLRSLLSILVFGPLLVVRPLVAIAGVVDAYRYMPLWQVAVAGMGTVLLALSVEPLLRKLPT